MKPSIRGSWGSLTDLGKLHRGGDPGTEHGRGRNSAEQGGSVPLEQAANLPSKPLLPDASTHSTARSSARLSPD